jgi:hypothetical protein
MSLYYVRIDCNGKAINLVTHKGLNIFEGYAIECSTTSKSWILKRVRCKYSKIHGSMLFIIGGVMFPWIKSPSNSLP